MRIALAVTAIVTALLTSPVFAEKPLASPVYREGIHYHALPEPVAVEDPAKIEVAEVFWYGCGHCFQFEPLVREWQKTQPDDIHFVQVPAMWSLPMEAHARAFYTAGQLGILEDVHQATYNALNLDHQRLEAAQEIAELFAEFGADEQEVIKTFESAEATSFLRAAYAKARSYQITGTPQLIVHGRYRIEANQRVPHTDMFKVVDFLVEKIRAEEQVPD